MYEKFKELDGTHPWRSVSPDGYVDYRARYRPQGRVLFFNFPLAKEMGLIPDDHPSSINKDLEQAIQDSNIFITFHADSATAYHKRGLRSSALF